MSLISRIGTMKYLLSAALLSTAFADAHLVLLRMDGETNGKTGVGMGVEPTASRVGSQYVPALILRHEFLHQGLSKKPLAEIDNYLYFKSRPVPFQLDSAVFSQAELNAGTGPACGRTVAGGALDLKSQIVSGQHNLYLVVNSWILPTTSDLSLSLQPRPGAFQT